MEEAETEECVWERGVCMCVDPRYWGEKVEGVGEDSGSWSDDHLRLVEIEKKSQRLILVRRLRNETRSDEFDTPRQGAVSAVANPHYSPQLGLVAGRGVATVCRGTPG
jgi:hypothetical protein